MTRVISFLFLLCVCFGVVTLTQGCADVQKAFAAYQEAYDNFEKSGKDVKALSDKLASMKTEYEDALKRGDQTKAQAALNTALQAMAELEKAQAVLDSGYKAVMAAKTNVDNAEGTNKYLVGIFSIIGGALGFGGGLLRGKSKFGNIAADVIDKFNVLSAAVKKTADNVDTFVPDEKWEAFLKAQRKDMSPKEIEIFDKARGA